VTTDARGVFVFEDLTPGIYGLAVNGKTESPRGIDYNHFRVEAGMESAYEFTLRLAPEEEKGLLKARSDARRGILAVCE
jgi:hypothetical protein